MMSNPCNHARRSRARGGIATIVALSWALVPGVLLAQDAGSLSALTRIQPGVSHAVTSSDPDFNSNLDRITWIQPGETAVLANIDGPAVIDHIWLTFAEAQPSWLASNGAAAPDEIVLRIYWDGNPQPAVEAPLGDFFAAGFGLRQEVRSVPIQVQGGDAYNSFWQMPFAHHARITVTNQAARPARSFYYQIDYNRVPSLAAGTAYFNAEYRRSFPEEKGKDYVLLDTKGEGHYVGTVMSVQARSPYWFGEGDARIYVDGDTLPTIQGTGTEDYFLQAWGLDPNTWPYFGTTYLSADPSDLGMRATMYRWHIGDPIRFTKSLRFTFEHTGWMSADETETGKVDGHVPREDDIATVAFWYQVGPTPPRAAMPDLAGRTFPDLDQIVQGSAMVASARHSSGTVALQKGYDWTGDGQIFFQPTNDSAWLEVDFRVDTAALQGLVLRMTHAPDYGRWRILVDGKAADSLGDYPDWDPTGPRDFYAPNVEVRDIYLGSYTLSPGKHTIRFELVGRNPLSAGHDLGFDSVRFRQRWHVKRPSLRPAAAKAGG
ncbi:MAG: glycoside hydrolase family 172 protein [Gemmatimonadales bacterium]